MSHPVFSSWRLVKRLGQGAFSKVYLASRLPLVAGTTFFHDAPACAAIKVVDLTSNSMPREQRRVLQAEGRCLRRFSLPGFVRCFDIWGDELDSTGKASSHGVFVLEYLSGGCLLELLKSGAVGEAHAAAIFHQVLTSVTFLHHNGYVHRDIKPENLVLVGPWDRADSTDFPSVRLIDMGLAHHYAARPHQEGHIGSPGYMAPETIRGHRHTPQMDMYSLGVLLFVMLTGSKPLPTRVTSTLSYAATKTADYPGVHMSRFRGKLSAPAQELCTLLMQRRPGDRPTALAALHHPWLKHHVRAWRRQGQDIRYLAVPRRQMKELISRNPSVTVLLNEARAAHSSLKASSRPRASKDNGKIALQGAKSAQLPLKQVAKPGPQSGGNCASAPLRLEEILAATQLPQPLPRSASSLSTEDALRTVRASEADGALRSNGPHRAAHTLGQNMMASRRSLEAGPAAC